MLVQAALFFLISSGSVFCAAQFRRKYEEILPITCASIVMLLFLFGIAGALKAGAYAAAAICLGLYVYSAVKVIRGGEARAFLRNVFTPAFFLFVLVFCLLSVLNNGKLASDWDEFTHWADIVKVMATIDDFGTNPNSGSVFKTYPPAMALFQYFIAKICGWLQPNAPFSEWRMYFGYQIFFLSFLFPFLSKVEFKRPVTAVIALFALCAAPVLFYPDVYTMLYIDPLLGILSGAGLAMVFLRRERDFFSGAYICLTAAMLVLAKAAGLLFAVFLIAAFAADEIISRRGTEMPAKKLAVRLGAAAGSVILPKVLWQLNVTLRQAEEAFPNQVSLIQLAKVVLHKDTSYRLTVQNNYWGAILTRMVAVGNTGVSISYASLVVITMAILYLLCRIHEKRNPQRSPVYRTLFWLAFAQIACYVVGLCVIYMFDFSEYEAVRLASFDRYLNIVFLSVWMMEIVLAAELLQPPAIQQHAAAAVLLSAVMLTTPWNNMLPFLSRASVRQAAEVRRPYSELTDAVEKYTGTASENIYLISEESSGFDFWVMRYSLRPCRANNVSFWSIGTPFYDGDIWTQEVSPEEWRDDLAENYDYVVIYHLNDYFTETYGSVFQSKSEIHEKGIYRVNKETKLLELCE